ncbi:uncharacterized protein AB675_5977 [Cyphellophora attinorum]|uniref:Xylanolytic transcriptional activator regulatory domain-containing protein n=1 Tax=Cyphellophora attinorum TaxID=1664694 RepID=A0A0N1NWK4_9EURO|nr:uncharacterized protein AB675_5977 [Phialophora attinorum]KPI36952.1 hypothetical protein AB675_5977 [Phialophora attinorum]
MSHHPVEANIAPPPPPLQTPGLHSQGSYMPTYQQPEMMPTSDPSPPMQFPVDGWSPYDMFEGFLDYADPAIFMDPSFMTANPFAPVVPAPAPMPPGSAASMQISNVLVPDTTMPPPATSFSAPGRPTPFSTPQPPARRPIVQVGRWRISGSDYKTIVNGIQDFREVLPRSFVFLTRHTMSRFLEGCFRGFLEHFPFIHFATFSVANTAPELLLAMAGIGAEFRFERHRSPPLFYAAKAILEERIRRHKFWSSAASIVPPPASTNEASSPAQIKTPGSGSEQQFFQETGNEVLVRWGQLQTLQAMIIVLAMGAWNSESLLREAMTLSSLAASLIRDSGKLARPQESPPTNWSDWAFHESLKRTKFMYYSILQLMSVAYNIPPQIYTAEIECDLPSSADEWTASDATSWMVARKETTVREVSFQDIFGQLFYPTGPSVAHISRFGSYVLLLGLLQAIITKRQTMARTQNISPHDIEELSRALKHWQPLFEHSPEAKSPNHDILSSNTMGLVRLAWIRLHVDLGPCRNLASRDPKSIAKAFAYAAPSIRRTPELVNPIFQATHSLSIPIRMGINYVAKTQTSSWSVQNSLANLECAILVSKWLEMLAEACSQTPLDQQEAMIVQTITSLVRESGMFDDEVFGDEDSEAAAAAATAADGIRGMPPLESDRFGNVPLRPASRQARSMSAGVGSAADQKQKLRRLAGAVARLWAEIFKGLHVFELVNIIGESLTSYAENVESVWMPSGGQY